MNFLNFEPQYLAYIFYLAIFALILLLVKMFKSKGIKQTLKKDNTSGFYKYHKETQFELKKAYGDLLEQEKNRQNKDSSKKTKKEKKKKNKNELRKHLAVLSFDGDVKAKQHRCFAKFVDELEVNKDSIDEVVVVITSPGGSVPQYGHVFSQMERIRGLGVKLTACIDVVGASGGYLMSLPAHKILAAPFSFVGSIGVAAFIPNLRKKLESLKIIPRTFTSGKFKRTITLTDNATKEDAERFQAQLDAIHKLFKDAVSSYRDGVDLERVATGEHWSAKESIEKDLNLVDELGTSSDYLLKRNKDIDLVYLSQKKNFFEDGVLKFNSSLVDLIFSKFLDRQIFFK